MHTKEVAYKTLVRPQLEYAAPILNPYHKFQIQEVEKVQRTVAWWTCRRWRNPSSVGDMLDELEWPSLEARREQSSLTFYYKIPSGTVSLKKDKYLTPAPKVVNKTPWIWHTREKPRVEQKLSVEQTATCFGQWRLLRLGTGNKWNSRGQCPFPCALPRLHKRPVG